LHHNNRTPRQNHHAHQLRRLKPIPAVLESALFRPIQQYDRGTLGLLDLSHEYFKLWGRFGFDAGYKACGACREGDQSR